jgi:DNA adenine methylase
MQQRVFDAFITSPERDTPAPLSPPLKWAGGKRWLLPHLQPIWDRFKDRRLVEPFCGGLAVALGLQPDRALLSDANPHLINFYGWLQKGLRAAIPMHNDEKLYYQHRAEFNQLVTSGHGATQGAAEFFYYLNRTGYNGLCRFNRKGKFNVPFGRYKSINYVRDFAAYKKVLRNWYLTAGDFADLPVRLDDFIYADPPYDVHFRQYAKDGFEWPDQERLAEWLARHPGPVVASNQATSRILELYRDLGFRVTLLDAPRMISCTGDRSPAKEMLAVRGTDPGGSE